MQTPASPAASTFADLARQLLSATASSGGSDLHLRAGQAPFLRVDGRLCQVRADPLTAPIVEGILRFTAGESFGRASSESWEFSFELPEVARFRGHAFRERGAWAVTYRTIPLRIPTFAELRLPPVVKTLATEQGGLVLVTGPTGNGKSTTLASMLHHMATRETLHILSVEDPVEYRLTDTVSCVTQREIGRDVLNFHDALHAAMREDPDVLFVGEIRDLTTLDVALQAAETGRAVFASFHTSTAVRTVQRLIAMFPSDEQAMVRLRLADALRGCLVQRLLPRRTGRGRVLCTEVLINNYTIRECIRDPQRLSSIPSVLERSADQQMHTLDQSLLALVREGLISPEAALHHCASPNDVKRAMQLGGVAL